VTYKSAGYFKCMWRKNNLVVCKTSTGAQHTIMIFRANWQEFHRILRKHQNREQRVWQNFWHNFLEWQWKSKTVFRNIEQCLFHFWPFKFPKRFLVSSKRWKLFSLNRSIRVSKNQSFHTDYKNVHKTLVNSAPNKIFLPKI
jgi:hypothetical protein